MKKHNFINFIETVSLQNQNARDRWLLISGFLVSFLIICLCGISGFSLFQALSAKQIMPKLQINDHNINSLTEEIKKLERDKNTGKTQLQKCIRFKESAQNPSIYLETIARAIPESICLDEIKYTKKRNLTLKGKTKTLSALLEFIDSLHNSSYFEQMKINALEPKEEDDQELFLFTLTGFLHKTYA